MPFLSQTFASVLRATATRKPINRSVLVRTLASVTDVPFKGAGAPSHYNASKQTPASLQLKSGQIFKGTSFGAERSTFGEAVFTTSLVGYPESMTDPSYRGQILVFTQPLIGNYGVPDQRVDEFGLLRYFESDRIQAEGIVVTDYSSQYSHWTAVESLGEWCARHNVPAITGVDTRAVVQLLRDQGSTLGRIAVGPEAHADSIEQLVFPDPNGKNMVAEVSTSVSYEVNPNGRYRIALLDFGVKTNILRCLATRGASITVLPWNFDIAKVASQYDGIFLSNGPGNPEHCKSAAMNIRSILPTYDAPIFGICMGNHILGMAAGLSPYKLQFGNRGHNQPALNLMDGKCSVTAQNHGYALDDRIMPEGWQRFWVNANDGSNEGIKSRLKPFMSVQFHPESKGGPRDTEYLFDTFMDQVRDIKAKKQGFTAFIPAQKTLKSTVVHA